MSTRAASRGGFELQRCNDCDAAIYPPRELCPRCLSDDIEWRASDGLGEVLASTTLARSFDPAFGREAHIPVISVKLDDGPVVIAFAENEAQEVGARVQLNVEPDRPLGPGFVGADDKGDASA